MIILTRLGNGMRMAVNPDLIERAEHTPDTVITLVDGHKLVVEESLEIVCELVQTWRASVAAEAMVMANVTAQDAIHTSMLDHVKGDESARDSPSEITAENAVLLDRSAHGSPFGRLLRLPSREV